MNCLKCNKEIQEDYNLCPYCGTKVIKNGILCPHCNEVVDGSFEVCSNCGKRFDGKKICWNCGIVVENDFNFCPKCACNLNSQPQKEEKKVVKPKVVAAPVKKKATKKVSISACKGKLNIIDLVKRSVVLVLAIIIFAFSFTNIFKMDFFGEISPINVGVSTFDFMDSWGMGKNYSSLKFANEYRDELIEWERIMESTDSEYYYLDATEDFLNSVNPIKFAKTELGIDTGFAVTQRVVVGIVGLLLILVALGFIIETGYGIYAAIFKKENKGVKYPVFELAIGIFYIIAHTFKINYALIQVGPGSGFTTIVVLAMVSAFIKFIYLAYENLKESEYQNWLEPALRVGRIALIIVAMFFVTAPVIKVDVKDPTTDTTYETVFKYSPYDLISYELALSQDMKVEEINKKTGSEYADYYNEVIEELAWGDYEGYGDLYYDTSKFVLSPMPIPSRVWNGQDMSILVALSSVQIVTLALLVAYLGYQLSYTRKAKSGVVLFIAITGLALVVLSVAGYSIYSETMEKFKIKSVEDIKYGLLPAIGLSLMFVAGLLDIKKKEAEALDEEEIIDGIVNIELANQDINIEE